MWSGTFSILLSHRYPLLCSPHFEGLPRGRQHLLWIATQQSLCLAYPEPLLLLQRKDTLLVEYKQLRKANTFLDKRFGGNCLLGTTTATGSFSLISTLTARELDQQLTACVELGHGIRA